MSKLIMAGPLILSIGILFLAKFDSSFGREIVVGGLGEEKPATPDVIQLVTDLQPDIKKAIETKIGGPNISGDVFAISYKSQVVNGVNYFIKVGVPTVGRSNLYFHVKIYERFDQAATFEAVQGPLGLSDRIEYFY